MKITQNTEIVVNGETYLLEEGDEIIFNNTLNEGIFKSIINRIFPVGSFINKFFEHMNPQWQGVFADIFKKDPKKAKHFESLFKSNPKAARDLFS